jgi:hypothetical protein
MLIKLRSKCSQLQVELINNRRIILPQNNVYENDSKSSVELLPGRRFALQQICVDLPRQTSKNYYVFAFFLM